MKKNAEILNEDVLEESDNLLPRPAEIGTKLKGVSYQVFAKWLMTELGYVEIRHIIDRYESYRGLGILIKKVDQEQDNLEILNKLHEEIWKPTLK